MPIQPSYVNTARISRAAAAHYWTFTWYGNSAASAAVQYLSYPFAAGARLVDVLVYQLGAGTGGTSVAIDVKNSAGTSMLSATAVATLASGGNQKTDALGELALPSGWTRPVVKTDTTPNVAKGDLVQIITTETGSYSPHPSYIIVLRFEPKQ